MVETDGREGSLAAVPTIEQAIVALRGMRVMLDRDLAILYGVETRALNQAVKRNLERFPSDFMFQLTHEEFATLRSQTVTFEGGRGQHRKYLPYAFTEQGVAMLSSVLRSDRAVRVNILIMQAFVRMRELALTHSRLARELENLRDRLDVHDESISAIFGLINRLLCPTSNQGRRIGFKPDSSRGKAEW